MKNGNCEKKKSHCLVVNSEMEKELVSHVLAYLFGNLGETETIGFLNQMNAGGVRFVDFINVLERKGKCGRLTDLSPIDRVRSCLVVNQGSEGARKKLKAMSAEEILHLSNDIEDGSMHYESFEGNASRLVFSA